MEKSDLAGQRFGRWLVTEYVGAGCWRVVCDCGNSGVVPRSGLVRGGSKQCRPCARQKNRKDHTTHGLTDSPLYGVWHGALKVNRQLGQVYAPWLDIGRFLADVGERPAGHVLTRRDPAIGHCPENTIWAHARTQKRSQYLEARGERRHLLDWSALTGVSHTAILMRLKAGWSVEDAIFTPTPRQRRQRHADASSSTTGVKNFTNSQLHVAAGEHDAPHADGAAQSPAP